MSGKLDSGTGARTVPSMRARRGYSLLELIVVVVLLLLVVGIGALGFRTVLAKSDTFVAEGSVRSVALVQQLRWENRTRFATDLGELANLEDNYTYLTGSAASLNERQVSVQATTWRGQPAVLLASLSRDNCAAALVVDPQLAEPQTGRWVITPSQPCSAQEAADHIGQEPWW